MFISYSHFDRNQCDRIADAIDRTNRFEIWYDKGLIPGEVYRKKIAEKLKETEVFILLISNASVKSEWIMDEVEYARSNRCRIIPVWLEPVVLPAELEMIVLRHHGLFWYTYQDDEVFTNDLLRFVGDDMEHSEEWQENKEEFSSEWWCTNSQAIRQALKNEKQRKYAYCYEADHALTLGRCYYYGVDETQIDPQKALFYFKISAYNGNQDAAFQLLQIELEQLEPEKQTEENCQAYIRKAEEMYKEGSVPAGLFLGNAYFYGRYGCPKDAAKSAAIYEACARKGNARAQYLMAWYYYHGIGVEQDYDLSVMYAQLAVEQKYLKAHRRLGIFFRDGLALPQDYKKAIEFFEEGEKAKDYYCFCLHGQMYAEGLGVEQNDEEALQLFKRGEDAPINGNRYSVYKSKQALGYFYELKGQEMLPEAAQKYLESYQLGNLACKQDYLRVTAETYQPAKTDGHYSFLD
jgi:hypothetical protein